jgi:3-oxoacyl-[acyl-carrier protein] reductase
VSVALVTGASRGIGAACAVALAEAGWDVGVGYGGDRRAAEGVADGLRAAGRRALVAAADVRDPEAMADAARAVEDALGPIDALVANAGVIQDGPAVRMGGTAWTDVIDTNLTGTYVSIRSVLAGMLRRRSGSIVAVSSVVGVQGNAGQANYAASKAGMLGLVRALAREVGPRGVRVNAVTPGYITTRLTADLPEGHRAGLLARTALGRLGAPEDVAGPVAFLCSPAAAFITGAVLAVDGGLSV